MSEDRIEPATIPCSLPDLAEVEQCDRDAAADLRMLMPPLADLRVIVAMRDGLLDSDLHIQAFARHRITTLSAKVERLRPDDVERTVAWLSGYARKPWAPDDAIRRIVAALTTLSALNAVLVQTSMDECDICGWRTFIPSEGCCNCQTATLSAEVERLRASVSPTPDP